MAADRTEIMAELMAGQTDLKRGQGEIIAVLGTQGEVLRLIAERLGILLEKLTPEIGEGPTMQELLAELVTRVGDNAALLRRIDRRTESMALALPDDVVRAMKGASGANRSGTEHLDANGAVRS
jgi:hypothetical protein